MTAKAVFWPPHMNAPFMYPRAERGRDGGTGERRGEGKRGEGGRGG